MADETQVQTQQEQEQQTTPTVDYGKIEQMINKGVQQKESAILKSYFEQQGMTEEEIKTAVKDYKANRARTLEEQNRANADKEKQYAEKDRELETLRAQLREHTINAKALDIGLDMGVDKNAVAYLVKMADLSKAMDEKGEISEEAIKNAFEQVLKDVPALKASQNSNEGFKVGADSYEEENNRTNILRKVAGLPPL